MAQQPAPAPVPMVPQGYPAQPYPPQPYFYPQGQPLPAGPTLPIQVTLQQPSQPAPYGYPPQAYGFPPQPGYGYPPQAVPYGYPPQPGYGYPPNMMPGQAPPPGANGAPAPAGTTPAATPAAAPVPEVKKEEVKKIEAKDFHGGTLKIVLHGARKLFDTNCCMSQSPFVRFTLGKHTVESEVLSGAGINCTWKDVAFFFAVRNVQDSIHIEVINSDFPCNKMIGEIILTTEKLLSQLPESKQKKAYSLHRDGARMAAGELDLSITFIPPLNITVHNAAKLYDAQLIGKQDPYVILTYKNGCGLGDPGVYRTKVHDDGDKYPKWEETFQFCVKEDFTKMDVVVSNDKEEEEKVSSFEAALLLEVWDENVIVDANIGYVEVPTSKLLEVKRSGKPQYFQLFKGSVKDRGKLFGGEICISVN